MYLFSILPLIIIIIGRVSALKYARDRPCIYIRVDELRASEIIRSQ